MFTVFIVSNPMFNSFTAGLGNKFILNEPSTSSIPIQVVNVTVTSGTSTFTEFWLHNSSTISRTYQCRRAIFLMAADDSTRFCFGGLCYGFETNISNLTLTVAPGDTIDFAHNGFHCDFITGTTHVCRVVYYRFEDPNNLGDSTNVIFQYNRCNGK